MKNLLKIEELGLFILGLFLFSQLNYGWGWFWGLLLVPDLGALGYLVNSKLGSWTYNLVHHRAIAIGLYLFGIWLTIPLLQFSGIVIFSHASMDRIFGYGLKYSDSFQSTHLGKIGGG